MFSTIDLSKQRTTLKGEPVQILEQITSYVFTDDLQVENLDEKVTYIYLNTIVDESRLFEELTPKINFLLNKNASWKQTLNRGKRVDILEKALELLK